MPIMKRYCQALILSVALLALLIELPLLLGVRLTCPFLLSLFELTGLYVMVLFGWFVHLFVVSNLTVSVFYSLIEMVSSYNFHILKLSSVLSCCVIFQSHVILALASFLPFIKYGLPFCCFLIALLVLLWL